MIEEIYNDVYDKLPEPIDLDKFYLEKFKNDNTNKEGKYRFSWRASRIYNKKYYWYSKRNKPVRIVYRWWMDALLARTWRAENEAYNYVLPYVNEIAEDKFFLGKKQIVSKYPYWVTNWKLKELCNATDIPTSHICNVASAILRDKYIANEVYLWRYSYIFGDVIVTQTGGVFNISLNNNIPWLNKNTIEDVHKNRMDWMNHKIDIQPPIYLLEDAYLLVIKPNERETYFYITPT